nr:hypothetical protein BaRGS_023747 [Batillaria attramentaria]
MAAKDWMAAVRGIEIFALVMLSIALTEIIYENACTKFRGRSLGERLATGGFCILTGLPGLAGVIVYVIKMDDLVKGDNTSYGWALALLAAGSGLLVVIGVGFLIHGAFLEKKKKKDKDPSRMNGKPYVTSNDENYELNAYTNRAMALDNDMIRGPPRDNLPGYAVYNGPLTRAGDRNSLPVGPSMFDEPPYRSTANVLPPYNSRPVGGGFAPLSNPNYSPPPAPKMPQYYSVSDDRLMDPSYDLSEGYKPVRRSVRQADYNPYSSRPAEIPYTSRSAENPYSSRIPENPYSSRTEDPYSARPSNIPRRFEEPPRQFARVEDPYNRLSRYESQPPTRPFNRDSYYQGAPF